LKKISKREPKSSPLINNRRARLQSGYSDAAHLCYHDDLSRREPGLGAKDDGACFLTHQDGSKFLEEYGKKVDKGAAVSG
jgi:hypothetical protein